jgi:hypothetical protein
MLEPAEAARNTSKAAVAPRAKRQTRAAAPEIEAAAASEIEA